ncbi:MAG: hypothetical protein BWY31_01941 [Lentisphaerae bacterium ADurb.Bin242]|nr:MAG: hypothetical protein BWY31_01941 [Lentisphaerae bacterium ADurb.Bin242]
MKAFFHVLFAAGLFPAFADNLLFNGALNREGAGDPVFDQFLTDKTSAVTLKTAFGKKPDGSTVVRMTSDKEKGVTAVIFKKMKPLSPGVNYYFLFRYSLKSFEPGSSLIVRINAKDEANKITKSDWSQVMDFSGTGEQEFIYPFRLDKGAASTEIVVYFRGVFEAELDFFHLGESLPKTGGADGNLIRNASFESPQLFEYYITPRIGKNVYRGKDHFSYQRSRVKARTGKYSLHCNGRLEEGSILVNMNQLPYAGSRRYRFSAWSYIVSSGGKARISASIGFLDANGKIISYRFPSSDIVPGQWNELKDEFYPPEGTVRITVMFWVSGQLEVFLDDFFFGPAEEKTGGKEKTASVLLLDAEDFTLWQEAACRKPSRTGIPSKMISGTPISLSCASNETEPFLVCFASKKKFKAVSLRFSESVSGTNSLSASIFSYRRVGFIELKSPDYNPTLKGWNADPLLPGRSFEVLPGENLPFYVTVALPGGSHPGVYRGRVSVLEKDRVLAEIPLEVKVRNFELPETPALRTFFYAWANQPEYRMLDQRPLPEVTADLTRLFKEHRMTGNQAQHPPVPKWKIENGSLRITDWSEFDRVVASWYSGGRRSFVMPPLNFLGDYYGWGYGGKDRTHPGKSPFADVPWLSPEGLKYAGDFAKQYTDHVRTKFPEAHFYAYLYDEPQPAVHADLAKITDTLHRAAPDLKIFITKEVCDTLGSIYAWCVPLAPGFVRPELQKKVHAGGGEIWYYNWTVCLDDHDYIRTRLYPWQIYAADGDGGLLWNTIWSPRGINPWTQMEKTLKCGGATIFYPPREPDGHIVPSLRAAQIKEGIDDFDYMKILEKQIDRAFPGHGKRRVKEIMSELLPDMPFGYRNDARLLYRLREKLGDEIDAFGQPPVSLVVSHPMDNSQTDLTDISFRVYASGGTAVSINGKAVGKVGKNGFLEVPFHLEKPGLNEIHVGVSMNGKNKEFTRRFFLNRDPQLDELEKLRNQCAGEPSLSKPIEGFLQSVSQGKLYTEKERKTAARLLEETRRELLKLELARTVVFRNDLQKELFRRAETAEEYGCYDRAEYYLKLSEEAAQAGDMKKFKVKISPTVFQGHPGFMMDNGILSAGFTETAGRLFSFKVRGMECLDPGSYANALPPADRMSRSITREMVRREVDYGGFSDEDAMGHWAISLVDWDVRFLELTPNAVSVAVSMTFPDRPFRITRIMSLRAESSELKMRYEITNLLPKGIQSDDPSHYQFAWRGRFVPAIGPDQQENDTLCVPAANDQRLPETRFSASNPIHYEQRNLPLKDHWAGTFDPGAGIGLAVLGDASITHGYVWFNSKGDHAGKHRIYTLEFPRSRYGTTIHDALPNSPFSILPGQTLNFSLTLRGVEAVRSEKDFRAKTGKTHP